MARVDEQLFDELPRPPHLPPREPRLQQASHEPWREHLGLEKYNRQSHQKHWFCGWCWRWLQHALRTRVHSRRSWSLIGFLASAAWQSRRPSQWCSRSFSQGTSIGIRCRLGQERTVLSPPRDSSSCFLHSRDSLVESRTVFRGCFFAQPLRQSAIC